MSQSCAAAYSRIPAARWVSKLSQIRTMGLELDVGADDQADSSAATAKLDFIRAWMEWPTVRTTPQTTRSDALCYPALDARRMSRFGAGR
ncbi:hypothetical protein RKD20_009354 [Streptomyces sp. SLBN-8D4]